MFCFIFNKNLNSLTFIIIIFIIIYYYVTLIKRQTDDFKDPLWRFRQGRYINTFSTSATLEGMKSMDLQKNGIFSPLFGTSKQIICLQIKNEKVFFFNTTKTRPVWLKVALCDITGGCLPLTPQNCRFKVCSESRTPKRFRTTVPGDLSEL